MDYKKQTWVDGETPLDAEHMNHIEDGITAAHEAIKALPEIPEIPEVPDVDATLSAPGAAADAAVVGQKVAEIVADIEEIKGNSGAVFTVDADGNAQIK